MLPAPGKRTVLLVEDDHALREMYRATLASAGFSVVAVEDGIDALRYMDGHTPNLVVLDLGLPRLGGEDVRRELASRPDTRDIPIVVVTVLTHGSCARPASTVCSPNPSAQTVFSPRSSELIARDASRLFHKSGDLEPLADHLDRVIH